VEYLPLHDLAAIAETVLAAEAGDSPPLSVADLARRLGRPYFTVRKAVQRIQRAGHWSTSLKAGSCPHCGQPVLLPPGVKARLHPRCRADRAAHRARDRRKAHPGLSTPYARVWKVRHPQETVEMREREKARKREKWPSLSEEERKAILERAHEADRRDYPLTLESADSRGEIWSSDEDQYVLDHQTDPARDVALALGRTLWAVRNRRVRLRRRQESRPID